MKIQFQSVKKSKVLKVTLCILLSLIVLIFLIVLIPVMINEVYKAGKGYKTLWEAKDVLAFYSVILSGIITFIALYVTINHSNRITKNQTLITMSLIKQPFFVIDCVKHQNSSERFTKNQFGCWYKNVKVINKHELSKMDNPLVLEIRNIGDGIALSAKYSISMFAGETPVQDSVIKSDNVFSIIYDLQDNLEDKYVKASLLSNYTVERIFQTYICISYQNTMGVEYEQRIEINLSYKGNDDICVLIKQISPQSINTNSLIN